MSTTIEWAYAGDNHFRLVQSDEDAGDGNTPAAEIDGSDESEHIALTIEGCAIYGKPTDLLKLLIQGASLVTAHLKEKTS